MTPSTPSMSTRTLSANALHDLPCQLPELGCFGCCGRLYLSREEVLISIKKNTGAWKEEKILKTKKPQDAEALRRFCWRQKSLCQSGVCPNIIEEERNNKKVFLCAVHPEKHGLKTDPRGNYCNTEFLCIAARKYKDMTLTEKKKYLEFLQEKIDEGMDSYTYSMLNDKDALWKEYARYSTRARDAREEK